MRTSLLLALALFGCSRSSSDNGVTMDMHVARRDAAPADLAIAVEDASDGGGDDLVPPAPSCENGILDGEETDVDCGGPTCPRCAAGKKCHRDSDCVTGYCGMSCTQRPIGFGAPTAIPVGKGPTAIVTADFDENGKADLAVTGGAGNDVTVLLGKGDGTFTKAPLLVTGNGPTHLVTADLDGDKHLDLVVANTGGDVSVFLGKGDGSFNPSGRFMACQGVRQVAVAELTGDGKPDVAVACVGFPPFSTLKTLTILPGDGTGSLGMAKTIPSGNGPDVVVSADLNGDKVIDLLVGSGSNRVDAVLADGKGGFAMPGFDAIGGYPDWIAIGDIDQDGKLDYVVAQLVAMNAIEVFLGKGDGTFKHAAVVDGGIGPRGVAIADLNGDKIPDIAVAAAGLLMQPDSNVRLFSGDGTGKFTFQAEPLGGNSPVALVAVDVNGDGQPDLAVVTSANDSVNILLNRSK